MRRTPEAGDARRDARERVAPDEPGEAHGRGRRILLVIGVEDEDAVERALDHRVHDILLGRDARRSCAGSCRVGQVVVRVEERLTDGVIYTPSPRSSASSRSGGGWRPCADTGPRCRSIVVEGRERADHAAHHRHRVRVAAEPAVEGRQLLVHHRVARDRVGEGAELVLARQFAVEQEVGDLHEARMLGKLADRIAAVEQRAPTDAALSNRIVFPGDVEGGVVISLVLFVSASRRSRHLIGNPAQAFLTPQKDEDVEDTERSAAQSARHEAAVRPPRVLLPPTPPPGVPPFRALPYSSPRARQAPCEGNGGSLSHRP
ncbi:hypothetical protein DdX_22075 [Ditylenchus destructor]|uniref:Uncharacterized protein n=1 Tax=Ditylenchus destructor TaxID=166010 RepID=A0AAD4MG99_9BILA|nr:hypothetical protein DdX_22075 [Ditylenchus destructor]